MKRSFEGKSVIVIGASGGLGSSFAKAFADKGARLLLVGRNEEKVKKTAEQITGDITTAVFDITDLQLIEELKDIVKRWSAHIDIVINASGYDVRKSLAEHSYEEAKNTLDINLLGAILITKAFLPHMREQKGSTIMHIGGFADGRLAFPYYSVDAASRAGLFTFIEAVNRELELEGSQARVAFFRQVLQILKLKDHFIRFGGKWVFPLCLLKKWQRICLKQLKKEDSTNYGRDVHDPFCQG